MNRLFSGVCRWCVVCCLSGAASGIYGADQPLLCKLATSEDYFALYDDQVSYESGLFRHYSMLSGLTVIVLNKQTLGFNRLSNLALLPVSTLDINRPAEPNQLMSGQCHYIPQ